MNNPTQAHLGLAKHVLKYLKGTVSKGLTFTKPKEKLRLTGFCVSDWRGSADRRSITGYCFFLHKNGPLISWRSTKQRVVALSSCEAEYVVFTHAFQEAKFLHQLYADITGYTTSGVRLYADNQGAIALAKNPVHPQRTKHIDIRYHFIRFDLEEGIIDLTYIPSGENVADLFTKPLSGPKLATFAMIHGPRV